jgi:hypothetical protein
MSIDTLIHYSNILVINGSGCVDLQSIWGAVSKDTIRRNHRSYCNIMICVARLIGHAVGSITQYASASIHLPLTLPFQHAFKVIQ